MTTLYLHVGHDKTGSTYLQSVFTLNRTRLREEGFVYPATGDDARIVDHDMRVPTGNGRDVLKDDGSFERILEETKEDGVRGTVFSSEMMFRPLANYPDLKSLVNLARRKGYDDVHVLLFVRNPIPHAVSRWQQSVKGVEAATEDLDEWIVRRFDWPEVALRLIEAVEKTNGIWITLRNYDVVKKSLRQEAEVWLGLSSGFLNDLGAEGPKNRSLTRSEVALQLELNRRSVKNYRVFGHRLVNRVPDVPRDLPVPSQDTVDLMIARLSPTLAAIDARLPEGHHYVTDYTAAPHSEVYTFSERQLAVIAEGIASAIEQARAEAGVREMVKQLLRKILRRARNVMTMRAVPRP